MKKILSRGLAAATLSSALLAGPALAAPVTVNLRVEGPSTTFFEGSVTTDARTIETASSGGPHPCNYKDNGGNGGVGDPHGTATTALYDWATSAGVAFDAAWTGTTQWGAVNDFFITKVKDVSNQNADPWHYWGLYVNGTSSSVGGCQVKAEPGMDVVWTYGAFGRDPVLRLSGPAKVAPGTPFTVKVTDASSGAAVQGATVRDATTSSNGEAKVTVDAGPTTLKAEKPDAVRSNGLAVCATNGADGHCGTTKPGEPAAQPSPSAAASPPAPPQPGCETNGRDGRCGTVDRQAPKALITGIVEQQIFRKGKGPRELEGVVGSPVAKLRNAQPRVQPDPSGILMVKLRLTRNDRGTCQYFSGRSQKLRRNRKGGRCGAQHGYWFKVGDRAEWSYLLPSRLPRGRYVLDVNAIDKAYNRDDARRRGENRVVFHVR